MKENIEWFESELLREIRNVWMLSKVTKKNLRCFVDDVVAMYVLKCIKRISNIKSQLTVRKRAIKLSVMKLFI